MGEDKIIFFNSLNWKLKLISMLWPQNELLIYSVLGELSDQGFNICSGFFEHFRVTTEFDATICIGIGDYTYLDPVAGDIFKLPESKKPDFESHELTEATDTIIFILKNSGE